MVALIHPRLLSSLSATFYPSLCTIQEATEVQDGYGQPIAGWNNIAGLIDLPCAIAPINPNSPQAAERKRADGTIEIITHTIAIGGHYPVITNKMRTVVAGVNYDIMAVETDSHSVMTRLRAVLVK